MTTRKPTNQEISEIVGISNYREINENYNRSWFEIWDEVCEERGFTYDFSLGCTCGHSADLGHGSECCLVKKLPQEEEEIDWIEREVVQAESFEQMA